LLPFQLFPESTQGAKDNRPARSDERTQTNIMQEARLVRQTPTVGQLVAAVCSVAIVILNGLLCLLFFGAPVLVVQEYWATTHRNHPSHSFQQRKALPKQGFLAALASICSGERPRSAMP
jgi:hypothetical protein